MNCIVVKLKESINNDAFLKFGERKFSSVISLMTIEPPVVQFRYTGFRFLNPGKPVNIKCYNCQILYKDTDSVGSEVSLTAATFQPTITNTGYNIVGFSGVNQDSYIRIENADSITKIVHPLGVDALHRMDTSFLDLSNMEYSFLNTISSNGCAVKLNFDELPESLKELSITNSGTSAQLSGDPSNYFKKLSGKLATFDCQGTSINYRTRISDNEFNEILRNCTIFRCYSSIYNRTIPFEVNCDVSAVLNNTALQYFWMQTSFAPLQVARCASPLTVSVSEMNLTFFLFEEISHLINLLSFQINNYNVTVTLSTSLSAEECMQNAAFMEKLTEKTNAGYTITIKYNQILG